MQFQATSKLDFPPASWVFSSLWRWLAFGLGTGLIRPRPGTWGTALAWLTWWLGLAKLSNGALAVLLVVTFIFGCWLCQRVGTEIGVADHSGINWDEWVAVMLVLAAIASAFGWQAVGFAVLRIFVLLVP